MTDKEKELEVRVLELTARIAELEKQLETERTEKNTLLALLEHYKPKSNKKSTIRLSRGGKDSSSSSSSSPSKKSGKEKEADKEAARRRVPLKQVANKVNDSIAAFDDPLYIAAIIDKYPTVVEYADPEKKWTIAHQACLYGPFEVVKLIFECGGDMAAESITGTTPFHYFFQHRYEDLSQVVDFINAATRKFPVNWSLQTTKGGDTFLHRAVSGRGEGQLVPYLLQRGVPANLTNSEGNTPLMIAIYQKQNDAIISLLAAGRTDTTIQNKLGHNALDAAKETGEEYVKMIEPYFNLHSRNKSSGESSGSKKNPLSLSVTTATGLGRRSKVKTWTPDEHETKKDKKDKESSKEKDTVKAKEAAKLLAKLDSRSLTHSSTFKNLSRSQRDATLIEQFRTNLIHDDEKDPTATQQPKVDRKIVRVYLEEDVELRQLGLTNTFRSLTIDTSSTVEEVENGIRGKMATGRTPMQVDFLKQCCGEFQLFAVYETGANNAWRCPLQECDLVWGITTQEGVKLVFSKMTKKEKMQNTRGVGSHIVGSSLDPRRNAQTGSSRSKSPKRSRIRRRGKSRLDELRKANFGVTFERLPTSAESGVPLIVSGLIACLRKAKLHEILPVKIPSEVALKLKQLKVQIDENGGEVPSKLSDMPAEHNALAAALLQNFLQHLPAPLIGPEIAPLLHKAYKAPSKSFKKMMIQSLIFSMPQSARATLQALTKLFRRVCKDAPASDRALLSSAYGQLFLRQKDRNVTDSAGGSTELGWQAGVLLFIVDHWKELFTADQRDVKWTNMEKNQPLLAAASMKELSIRLLDPHYQDDEFLPAVFMCTEYFSSNTALLAEVQKLFERAQTVEKASWRQFMARRFCSLLITWVECTGEQLCQDKGFRAAITKILPSLQKPLQEGDETEDEDVAYLRECFVNQKSLTPSMMKSASFYQRLERETEASETVVLSLIELSTFEVAQQLMLLNHTLLSKIKVKELLKARFTDPNLAPNFNQMTESANTYSMWSATVIVQESTAEERAQMIAKLVDVAEESQKINDFHSCVCIVLGLMSPAVCRLKSTWMAVSQETLERFQALCSLASPEHNSSTLRALQQQAPLPVVPFVQLLKKDLLTAEEIPTKLSSLVNVNKARVLHRMVERLQRVQEIPPLIPLNPILRNWLQSLPSQILSDDALYKRSLELEPRTRRSTISE